MSTVTKLKTETVHDPLPTLCAAWRLAKSREEEAKEARLAVEQQMIDYTEFNKIEGTETIKSGDYRVKLTAKLTRKLDEDAYMAVMPSIPENMRPVRYKPELIEKGVKWLMSNEPDTWALIAPCITTKPAKVAVEVAYVGNERGN
jgi:hypothetical protein